MESQCLLCLEIINADLVSCIDIYSDEWRNQNIESLIEQHLWPVATLKSLPPWLCSTCWKALHEFHLFYRRIEDVHSYFDYIVKSEQNIQIEECKLTEFVQDNLDENSTVCETVTTSDNNDNDIFSNHESENDVQENSYKCQYCLKDLTDQQSLLNHLEWHDGYMSQQRQFENSNFFLKSKYDQKSTDLSQNKPQYICADSDYEKSTENISQKIESDESTSHSNSKIFKCCNIVKDEQLLLKHISWHKGQVYLCQICDLKFLDKSKLENHKRLHTSCGKSPNYDDKTNSNIQTATMSRSVSSMSFNSVEQIVENKSCIKCKYCSKVVEDERALSYHKAWHEGNVHSCEICDLKFFDLNQFESHKSAHTVKRGAQFSNAVTSKLDPVCHELEIVEDESDTRASIVPKNERALSYHKAWHKGNVYSCEICDIQFFDLNKFESHKSAHTLKRGTQFSNMLTSKLHTVCHELGTEEVESNTRVSTACDEEVVFHCGICDLKFTDSAKFYNHKSTHASKRNSSCDSNEEKEDALLKEKQEDVDNLYQEHLINNESEWEKGDDVEGESESVSDNDNAGEVAGAGASEGVVASAGVGEGEGGTNIIANISINLNCNIQLEKVKCKVCFKVLEDGLALLNHKAWHEGDTFHCDACELKFFDKSKFENHKLAHTMSEETPDSDNDDSMQLEYFVCKFCSKVLNNRRLILNHNAWHMGNIHYCDICDMKFCDKSKYDSHVKIHLTEPLLPCPDCGKTFAYKYTLRRHRDKMHRNMDVQVCDICGMSYRCPFSFKRHINRHKGNPEPKLPCDICGRLLKGKNSLKTHKLILHPESGVLPYVCDICLKPLASQSRLNRHIVVAHTSVGEYKCPVCNKSFRKLLALKNHSTTHAAEPKYTCHWCPQKFYASSVFSKHKKKVHPKEYEEWKRNLYMQS